MTFAMGEDGGKRTLSLWRELLSVKGAKTVLFISITYG